MDTSTPDRPQDAAWYEIRLQGRLGSRWASWFDGLTLTCRADGTTVLRGWIADQAALHGLLTRIRDVGLPLLSVARVEPGPGKETHPTSRRLT